MVKVCSCCKQEKSIVEFFKDKSKKIGCSSKCKDCYNKNNREKDNEIKLQYYYNNRERILEYQNKYDKENFENRKIYRNKYYINHKEEHLERRHKRYQVHKEEEKEQGREYNKTSKGRLVRKISSINRRVFLLNSSKLTVEKIQQVYERNIVKYKVLTCELCFKKIKFGEDSIDHKVPVCRVAEFPNLDLHELNNLGIAHFNCNCQKNYRTLDEWFQLHPELQEKK